MRQECNLAQAHFSHQFQYYVHHKLISCYSFLLSQLVRACFPLVYYFEGPRPQYTQYIAGLLKMASSAIMTSPGFLRLLSSRTAYGTIPIWNCRSNENFYNCSPLSILTMSAQPKPVSMSPFLGVRLCSSSSIKDPPKVSHHILN